MPKANIFHRIFKSLRKGKAPLVIAGEGAGKTTMVTAKLKS